MPTSGLKRRRAPKREDPWEIERQWAEAIVRLLETPLDSDDLQLRKDMIAALIMRPLTSNRLQVNAGLRRMEEFEGFWRKSKSDLQRDMRAVAHMSLSKDSKDSLLLPPIALGPFNLSTIVGTLGDAPATINVLQSDIRSALLLGLAMALRRDPDGPMPMIRRCAFEACPHGLDGPRFFATRGKRDYCSTACSNRRRQRVHYRKTKDEERRALQRVKSRSR